MALAMEKKQFTDARRNFTDVFDTVVNKQKPLLVNRRKDDVFMIERQMQKEVLRRYTTAAEELPEDNGSVTIAVDELDIAVNGATRDQALQELVQELKVYAEDYVARLPLFLNSPNRRPHLPFILRVQLADNDAEILEMVCLRASGI
jgi:antitoxin YefM